MRSDQWYLQRCRHPRYGAFLALLVPKTTLANRLWYQHSPYSLSQFKWQYGKWASCWIPLAKQHYYSKSRQGIQFYKHNGGGGIRSHSHPLLKLLPRNVAYPVALSSCRNIFLSNSTVWWGVITDLQTFQTCKVQIVSFSIFRKYDYVSAFPQERGGYWTWNANALRKHYEGLQPSHRLQKPKSQARKLLNRVLTTYKANLRRSKLAT